MNTAIIILIIILVVIFLLGLGFTLYFIFRKKPPTNTGMSGSSGMSGISGMTGTNGFTGLTGTNGTVIVPGNFSIRSVASPTLYITLITNNAVTSMIAASSDNNIRCDYYSWQNQANYIIPNGISDSILINNASNIIIGGEPEFAPPPFILINFFRNLVTLQIEQLNSFREVDQTIWRYNQNNKTWCGPSEGFYANTCLYLETDNTISSKNLSDAPNDPRFQWENVPVVSIPNCIPPPLT